MRCRVAPLGRRYVVVNDNQPVGLAKVRLALRADGLAKVVGWSTRSRWFVKSRWCQQRIVFQKQMSGQQRTVDRKQMFGQKQMNGR